MINISTKNICAVFLLSTKEWEEAVATVPNIPIERSCWWWLRSPGCSSYYAASVNVDGDILDHGITVFDTYVNVRPAFIISDLTSEHILKGNKVKVGNHTICTVIADDVVLADSAVCKHRFDANNNNYDTSEIRKYINSEEFLNLL